ncbi:class I SAM-dependent methyltransferase, partial [Acinetobacter baumannii]
GIDISLDYLRRAREAGISVCFSRIEDMPYKDGFFDAIVCTDVLEHVLDLNYCTAQILRVLRPGGVLILRVPHNDLLEVY